MKNTTPSGADKRLLNRDLGDGLVLRTLRSEEDIEKLARMHQEAFGEDDLYIINRDLLTKDAHVRWEDVILVEDTKTNRLVSSISLIPGVWEYEHVPLRVAELGVVGTLKEYRHRGLIRAQMEVFERKLQEGGFDLGVIRGIPYFYRQFGYEYAIPLDCRCTLGLDQIPALAEGEEETVAIRPLTQADTPQALSFYKQMTDSFCLRAAHDADSWRYPETLSVGNPMRLESYIVEQGGRPVGYFRVGPFDQGRGSIPCCEASALPYAATLATLRFLKRQAQERGGKAVALELHQGSPLVKVARYLGGQERKPYAWQVRIPDRIRFFQHIAPVLERRLAESPLAGLTQRVPINFYRETVELVFQEGRLERVSSLGKTEEESIRVPPDAEARLLTCYQSREEIAAYRLDLTVRSSFQLLVDALFPKKESYIYKAL